jgi:hypothetical protein
MPKPSTKVIRIRKFVRPRDGRPVVVHRLRFGTDGQSLVAWFGPNQVGNERRPGTYELCWLALPSGRVTRRTGLLNDTGFEPYPNWDPAVTPDLRLAAYYCVDGSFITLDDGSNRPYRERSIGLPGENGGQETAGLCFGPDGRQLYMAGFRGLPPPFGDRPACQVMRCDPHRVLRRKPVPFVPRQVPNPFREGQFVTIYHPPLLQPWKVVADIPDPLATVTAQSVSLDGRMIAVGSSAGMVWLFDLKTGVHLAAYESPTKSRGDRSVYRLRFTRDGSGMIILDGIGLILRPLTGPGKAIRLRSLVEGCQDMALFGDTTILVTTATESVLELDVKNGRSRHAYELGLGPLYGIAVDGNGRRAAAGLTDGRIVIWDLRAPPG